MLVDDEKYIFLSTDEDVINLLSSRVKNLDSLNFEELMLFAEMFGLMRGYYLFDISDVPPGAYTPPTATFEIHKREKEWDISCTYSFMGQQSLYSFSFSAEQGLQFSKKELVQYYFTY